jgi:hypothetical protein
MSILLVKVDQERKGQQFKASNIAHSPPRHLDMNPREQLNGS